MRSFPFSKLARHQALRASFGLKRSRIGIRIVEKERERERERDRERERERGREQGSKGASKKNKHKEIEQ